MSIHYKIIIVLGLVAAAYGVGRYLQPAEVITETEVVEKIVEVESEKDSKETRTIERVIERPDGTTVTETIEEEIEESETTVKKDTSKKENSKKIVKNLKPQWRVQGMASLKHSEEQTYTIGVERRVFGSIFAGAYSRTDFKEYGVSISMEF